VQWPYAGYLHLCASVTKQYNLVPVKGVNALRLGRWSVGDTMAMCNRLCGLSTYGFKAHIREITTPPKVTFGQDLRRNEIR